jgi:hypothetical protein
MKLKIVKQNLDWMGQPGKELISIMDVETGEMYESGYDNMEQAKKALKNFKETYA